MLKDKKPLFDEPDVFINANEDALNRKIRVDKLLDVFGSEVNLINILQLLLFLILKYLGY